jgi:hypothetical protein
MTRTSWLRTALVAWALGYGALRVYWAAGHLPYYPPMGGDPLALSGWGVVGLIAVATLVGLLSGVRSVPRPVRWLVACAGVVSAAGLVFAPFLLLLDVVGLLFPGVGMPFTPVAFASRLGCLAGGLLTVAVTVALVRELRGVCPHCGRRSGAPGDGRTPRWAYAAGYLAVLGCVTRLAAQAWVGFSAGPDGYAEQHATSRVLFLVALILAGTLLPIALVHSWGRRLPWWLPLAPALFVSAGLIAYFGTGLLQLIADGGNPDAGGLPQAFYWVAVPAYLLWGTGLGAAALSYRSRTRPACRGGWHVGAHSRMAPDSMPAMNRR